MAKKEPQDGKKKDGGKKKPYVVPKLAIAGSLLAISKSTLSAITLACCITERLRQARKDAGARGALVSDIASAMTRG